MGPAAGRHADPRPALPARLRHRARSSPVSQQLLLLGIIEEQILQVTVSGNRRSDERGTNVSRLSRYRACRRPSVRGYNRIALWGVTLRGSVRGRQKAVRSQRLPHRVRRRACRGHASSEKLQRGRGQHCRGFTFEGPLPPPDLLTDPIRVTGSQTRFGVWKGTVGRPETHG